MIEAREACIHYWMVEPPNGPVSKGICKLCGTEKEYYNSPAWMREDGNQSPWHTENKGTWADKLRREGLATRLAIADEKSG